MHVEITGKDMVVTEALLAHVKAKINRLARDARNIEGVRVTLWVEKDEQWAQASVKLVGTDFVCKAKHADMYTAIKLVGQQALRSALKHKAQRRFSNADRQSIRHIEPEPLEVVD